ncbi:MAG: hypothetical protein ACTSR8_05725 [Promethearchaeota archaeon]
MRLETFVFTPVFMGFFAAIFQTILVCTFIYESDYKSDKKWKNIAFDGALHFGFGAFFMFGIIFFETAIFWLFGQSDWLDWQYSFFSIILLFVLGFEYIVGTMLTKPTYMELIFCAGSTTVILIMLHICVPYSPSLRSSVILTLGVMVGMLVLYMVLWGLNIFRTKEPSWSQGRKEFWDFRKKFRWIFSRKVNFALYIIAMANALLNLFGSSFIILFLDFFPS